MTDQTNTTVPRVFQGYHWVGVQPANGGFGEYVAGPEKGDEYYPDADDLIKAQGPGEHLSTARGDWMEHENAELTKAISDVTGHMYDEPEILVAMRDEDGEVTVFGIDSVDCYEQVNGEYVPVAQHDEDPERYTLS